MKLNLKTDFVSRTRLNEKGELLGFPESILFCYKCERLRLGIHISPSTINKISPQNEISRNNVLIIFFCKFREL